MEQMQDGISLKSNKGNSKGNKGKTSQSQHQHKNKKPMRNGKENFSDESSSKECNKVNAPSEMLTEKQLTKLEWDKKFAELKLKEKSLDMKKKPNSEDKDNKMNIPCDKLNEKLLRKLQWEKKLAEQKGKEISPEKTEMSKADIKAKRREQQEAQRILKSKSNVKPEINPAKIKNKFVKTSGQSQLKRKSESDKIRKTHEVQLVKHLYVKDALNTVLGISVHKDVHPAFVKLGVQFMYKTILGSNARCLALLAAVKSLVEDLETPPKQEFCRYIEVVLQICTNYLQKCRPFAVSMTNALRYFKVQLTLIDTNQKDNEKKAKLIDIIDTYIRNDIQKAGDAISIKVNEKIIDGDVILIYGCSSLIKKILTEAHGKSKKFEVIIVDGRPLLEGKEMLRRLVVAGIKCTYVLINAVSYVMGRVTKVVLGAHALLTNGYVVSRIGTAQVALVAQAYNKPVLVCCETYKFSERVQTDSFVDNEIYDANIITTSYMDEHSPLSKWENIKTLTPLNLLYDVTPPDLVAAVITEIAILPCTSVPVVLRINANET